MTQPFRVLGTAALMFCGLAASSFALPAAPPSPTFSSSALPDAPEAQADTRAPRTGPGDPNAGDEHSFLGLELGPGYPPDAGKWDTIINDGQHARRLSAWDKLLYAGHEQIQPVVLVPAIFSSGYGQIADANPRYGIDMPAYGERFGAAMLRQATDRISGDGILAAVFRQDPRFYREAEGPILHRGLHAVSQTFVRRTDDGTNTVNASGILGHAVANGLAMTYYPHVSATTYVAFQGFGTSLAADMGSKLLVEFGPDVLRKTFRIGK